MNYKNTPEWREGIKEVEKLIETKVKPLQKRIEELEKVLAELRQEKPTT
jgi:hypothetical protein